MAIYGESLFVMSYLLLDHLDDLPNRAELVATFSVV
jgi:hypothetical protein